MPCEAVKLPGGGYAMINRPNRPARPCSVCKRKVREAKLCDFPVGKGKTCDAALCEACATHKEPDTDYCPTHARMLTPEGRLKL